MTTPEQFVIAAAKRYLQNVVFVDDEIYARDSNNPSTSVAIDLPGFKPPIKQSQKASVPTVGNEMAKNDDAKILASTQAESIVQVAFHPRQLVDSFAEEGIVCALYEPKKDFAVDANSLLFKLCERADVVILDWELFGGGGTNILPLIQNLAGQSQSSYPHHSRLCVVYTGTPELTRVNGRIYDHLKLNNIECDRDPSPTTLNSGAMKIVVLGKSITSGRPEAQLAFEVSENNLPERIIAEFAAMHKGILPAYALNGLAAIRSNSKRILDRFHRDLDGTFLVHRAMGLPKEEAFEQLPELLAEEILAVLTEAQPTDAEIGAVAQEIAAKLHFSKAPWGKNETQTIALVREFFTKGAGVMIGQRTMNHKAMEEIHSAIGCDESMAHHKLAALFNLRTNYTEANAPALLFGTIIREKAAAQHQYNYAVCLMPLCDSVRLDNADGKMTIFPFWSLSLEADRGGSKLGIVVRDSEDKHEELFMNGRARDNLWLERFTPSQKHLVEAVKKDGLWIFEAENRRFEWIAQLKPTHAQRIANDVGMSLSRIAVNEAEWLRRKAGA